MKKIASMNKVEVLETLNKLAKLQNELLNKLASTHSKDEIVNLLTDIKKDLQSKTVRVYEIASGLNEFLEKLINLIQSFSIVQKVLFYPLKLALQAQKMLLENRKEMDNELIIIILDELAKEVKRKDSMINDNFIDQLYNILNNFKTAIK